MESSVLAIHTPAHAPVDQERVTASSYAPLADISRGGEQCCHIDSVCYLQHLLSN